MYFNHDEYVNFNEYLNFNEASDWRESEREICAAGGLQIFNEVTQNFEWADADSSEQLGKNIHLRNSLRDSLGRNGRARSLCLLLRETLRSCGLLEPETKVLAFECQTVLTQIISSWGCSVRESTYINDTTPSGDEFSLNGLKVEHQDVTCTSFKSESFNMLFSNDVLEHVPDTSKALREMRRILKPGGINFIGVPFFPRKAESIKRARKNPDGTITHILPPEYHGDPKTGNSILTFYNFGWDLLEMALKEGYRQAGIKLCYSRFNGTVSDNHPMNDFRAYPIAIILMR